MVQGSGVGVILGRDSDAITNSTEVEHLLELGKPQLREVTKVKIDIKQSQEFNVKCHECLGEKGRG